MNDTIPTIMTRHLPTGVICIDDRAVVKAYNKAFNTEKGINYQSFFITVKDGEVIKVWGNLYDRPHLDALVWELK